MVDNLTLPTLGASYSTWGTQLNTAIGSVSSSAANQETIVFLGDSLTANGGQNVAELSRTRLSYWPWALNMLGQRLKVIANLGVGGEQTSAILARTDAAVALKPGWMSVLAGTNDVGNGVATATSTANLTAIYDKIQAAGIGLIIGPIPPRNSATTQQKNDQAALNTWIRDEATRRRGVVLVDYEAACTDSSTGAYPTVPSSAQWTSDGVHPNSWASFAMGRAFANAMRPRLNGSSPLTPLAGAVNLLGLVGGRFALGSGDPASGWARSQYAVIPTASTPARTDDVYGTWRQEIVPASDKCFYNLNVTVDGVTLSVGDTVELLIEYEISALQASPPASSAWFTAKTQAYVGGNFIGANMRYDIFGGVGVENYPTDSRSGIFRTPPLTIPASTTLVQCLVEARGGGTYRFGRAILRKV